MSVALLEEGRRYVEQFGWSIIPIAKDEKTPPKGFEWKPFQARRPTQCELIDWAKRYPSAGVGIVTGRSSGLVVIDADGDLGRQSLGALQIKVDQGPICLTPRQPGCHVYYKHPGFKVENRVGLRPGLDVRGDGGYVVAPKSHHYEWLIEPDRNPLPQLPDDVLRLVQNPLERSRVRSRNFQIPVGQRNRSVFLAACGFAKSSGTLEHHRRRVIGMAKRCIEPLPDKEVERIVKNSWSYKFKS